MERFVGFGGMNLVGKLGAAVGMSDVREKKDIMDEARGLGVKIQEALKSR